MDRKTVFTKTAKGLMEATGKTSVLSRDLRALLKEIDGKATVDEVQARLGKLSEAKLLEILNTLATGDFIREFTRTPHPLQPPQPPQPPQKPAADEMNLDFTMAIPTASPQGKKAGETARQQAKADAEAKARAAAAEAAARARAEVEIKAKAVALEKANAVAAAEAAVRARAEAEARARAAAEAAVRAKAEAEARARAEAEARAKRDAEEQARREAEARARKEAEARAQAEEQARIEAEARARKDAEEHARVEAELKARLEDERKAREEAERRAKAEAERERREAEEKARREADALRAKLEDERKAREESERRAKAEAERERREAEEKARREADELRARLEEERQAKAEAERERREAEEKARREADELRAKLEEERQAREEAERKAKAETERERKEAEEKARREADQLRARLEEERRVRDEAERKAKEQAERKAREDAERKAKEQAERVARETEARAREEQENLATREAEARARDEAQERLRRDAEDQAKREAEAQARKVAADATRHEAAERAPSQASLGSGASLDDLVKIEIDFDAVLGAGGGTRQEAANISAGADDKLQQEVEAKARKEAEEQARAEAEEQARRKAETEAERNAEARRRKDEAEQQRDHAADRARADPAAWEREHAEAQARIQAQNEETERHFAEMEKELEAEGTAAADVKQPAESSRDARKRDKKIAWPRARAGAAREEAPVVYRTPINWRKPVALGLFLILALGLVLVHFISFDSYIPQFEKLAGAHLQQPVKIKELHLSLVPLPHWRLDGVSVGQEGQLAAARIKAVAELGSMFSEQKVFKSIELESPVLSEQGLLALLFGRPQGQDFKVASVIVKNGKLNSKSFILPALDAKIAMGENGAWKKIALDTPDHKTSLLLEPKGEVVQLEVETNAFTMPFGPAFILENFVAKGVIGRGELMLSEFKGGIYGGYLSGTASLKWSTDWSFGGDISARAMEPGRFAPTLVEDGKLEGKAVYAMRAKSYDELFVTPRVEGTFAVQKGSLLGVNLARLLQGGGIGGKTPFAEVTGGFVREGGRTQLRQVHLRAGPVSAAGSAEADAGKNLSGRFAVELKSPVAQARANLALSGTLREPHFNR